MIDDESPESGHVNGEEKARGFDPGAMARDVAGRTAGMAGEVRSRLPGAAASTRDAVSSAQQQMGAMSDEMLTGGALLSLGIALGLLLANASRLFVAALGHPYGPNAERGVFRSTDGGAHFEKVLYKDEYTSANDVHIDAANPNIVYAGLWQQQQGFYENGAFGGTDGGIFNRRMGARPGSN